MAETDIACPAMDVYSYITDPANWEDGRPVTDPGWTLVPRGRQPAGTTWRESKGEDWAILESEPGRRWIVRSRGVGDTSSVTITYSFSEVEGMTHLFRHMEIEVSAGAAINEHARAAFTCSKPGRDVVTVIKRVLEASHQVVAPRVAAPVSISRLD
ncbi:hypothetical protein E1161_19235 [Saccharopolyspora aridisoli]|uniref:SRPBCC family protein n=1 Tax=Saccharopolyspora aridisoli TaxID=2530385 RepID=A0A4R4UP20_9PSEU|nr:hypothetical protein [Saccharopolyspora aridisoli]TDC90243.1 hypothetical protein E1161_19235 [Saccharopolyspora aridisoli]